MVDATYFKVRENGRIGSIALMIAIGINEVGIREVVDFTEYNNESNCTRLQTDSLKVCGMLRKWIYWFNDKPCITTRS